MYLTFVRHAEPARNVSAHERNDPGLSERGVAQARCVAEFLAGEPCDALYTSPLRRARETAAHISAAVGRPAVVVDELAEFGRSHRYQHFEDLTPDDPHYQAFLRGDLSPWGTDAATFRSEVLGAIGAIVERHRGQHVVLVSHGGVANVFFGHVLGIDGLAFHAPAYVSISRARAGKGKYTIISLNETGHLRLLGEGLSSAPEVSGPSRARSRA